MRSQAAKQGDRIVGTDVHIVLVPAPPGNPVATPLPHPFSGEIDSNTSPDVMIDGQPAATVGSVASNNPPHVPTSPGTEFQTPPANRGRITAGSGTVTINDRAAARHGDAADTCDDAGARPLSSMVVVAASTVEIG
ncbi:MAG: PAAR domain-containing protein [Rhodospirillales bacterium]